MSIVKIYERLRKVRAELFALSVLVPLVIILGALLVRWPSFKDLEINETKTDFIEVASISPRAPHISLVPVVTKSVAPVSQNYEGVTFSIESEGRNNSWQVEIEKETTVEEILKLAVEKGFLIMETVDYGSSMGVFVESLNGVKNNNIENIYWHLYVNDVLSPVGATHAEVKASDIVTWKYEKDNNENN